LDQDWITLFKTLDLDGNGVFDKNEIVFFLGLDKAD